MTSEMRAKIRPADWRRASEFAGGERLVSAAPRVSESWPTAVVESRRVMSCGELTAD